MNDYQDDPQWLALCAEVIAKPDDDLPRVVSADWLEEHGQNERAHAIWLYCLNKEFQFVLDQDRPGTRRALGLDHIPPSLALTVNRGYLKAVQCTWAEWERWGPWLAKRHPIEKVVVSDKQPTPYGHRWWFTDEREQPTEHILPRFLFDFFAHRSPPYLNIHEPISREPIIQFLTGEEAFAALSVACLAWARATPDVR